jgi:acyl-coenzyme A thioesterase PaaI-like protein
MIVSENTLKWLMRFYPPLFFQRIWIQRIYPGFRGIDVKVNRSLLTINLGKSIFGGTIFSATDPFHALLFGQLMQRKGFHVTVWLKSAGINYLKPARTSLNFTIQITDTMIAEAEHALRSNGKFIKSYPIELFDKDGDCCARAVNEIYIRNLDFVKTTV